MDWQVRVYDKEVYIVNPPNHFKLIVADDFEGAAIFYEENYEEAKAAGCPREILKNITDHYDRMTNQSVLN